MPRRASSTACCKLLLLPMATIFWFTAAGLTMSPNLLTWIAAGAVCCYYVVMRSIEGRDPQRGTIVIRYEPPQVCPLRCSGTCGKRPYDDRTFWAGLLSLVAKGLETAPDRDRHLRREVAGDVQQ